MRLQQEFKHLVYCQTTAMNTARTFQGALILNSQCIDDTLKPSQEEGADATHPKPHTELQMHGCLMGVTADHNHVLSLTGRFYWICVAAENSPVSLG